MSTWTHIAGAIRFDAILAATMVDERAGDAVVDQAIRYAFGKTFSFEDLMESVDPSAGGGRMAPAGSEGSAQYRVIKTSQTRALSWGAVLIWGDLRDYDDWQALREWIIEACQILLERGIAVRNVAVEIQVEGGMRVLLGATPGNWSPPEPPAYDWQTVEMHSNTTEAK
jgi:hypothetical protein